MRWATIGVIGVSVGVAGAMFIVGAIRRARAQESQDAAAQESAERAQAEINRRRDEEYRREDEETSKRVHAAILKRLNSATFTAFRLGGLDGDCRGGGFPPYAYKIEGSLYSDNEWAAESLGCRKWVYKGFKVDDNLFCCASDKLPKVLPVHAESEK